jgi:hypothetical protein
MNELLKNKNLFSLPELSQFIKTNISKSSSKVVDYTEDIHFDDDSDKDEFDDEEDNPEVFDDQDEIVSNSDDEEVEDGGSVLTSDLSDAEKNIFQGCRIYDKVSPQQINKYFRIRLGSSWKYVHKQTAY